MFWKFFVLWKSFQNQGPKETVRRPALVSARAVYTTAFRPMLTKWSHAVPAQICCHELDSDVTLSIFPVTYKWVVSHMIVINHMGLMWEMSHTPYDYNCNQSYGKIIWDTTRVIMNIVLNQTRLTYTWSVIQDSSIVINHSVTHEWVMSHMIVSVTIMLLGLLQTQNLLIPSMITIYFLALCVPSFPRHMQWKTALFRRRGWVGWNW